MSAPLTMEQRKQVIQFNNRFTLHYFGDTQLMRIRTEALEELEVVLPQGHYPDQFKHPDAGTGVSRRACVRARLGSVTVGTLVIDGFVGHDLITNSIMVFSIGGETLYHSSTIREVTLVAL